MRSMVTRIVNADGEVVREETERDHYHPPRRYRGPWSIMMQMSGEGLRELEECLTRHDFGMQAVRVLFAMLGSLEVHGGNRVRAGRKDLARLLEMDEAAVSKAIKRLVECGFVEAPALRFSPYVVSPRFAWNGTTHDLKTALGDRGMLDRRGMMKARQAA